MTANNKKDPSQWNKKYASMVNTKQFKERITNKVLDLTERVEKLEGKETLLQRIRALEDLIGRSEIDRKSIDELKELLRNVRNKPKMQMTPDDDFVELALKVMIGRKIIIGSK